MSGRLPSGTLSRAKAPLAQDPVLLHIRKKQWRPQLAAEASPASIEMIDRGRLANCVQDKNADEALSFLRPITLDRWLKTIEKKRSIQ